MNKKEKRLKIIDELEDKRAEGFFEVTSICKGDLREIFKNNPKALKVIDKLNEGEMKHLAEKVADGFCNCCYWSLLRDCLEDYYLK